MKKLFGSVIGVGMMVTLLLGLAKTTVYIGRGEVVMVTRLDDGSLTVSNDATVNRPKLSDIGGSGQPIKFTQKDGLNWAVILTTSTLPGTDGYRQNRDKVVSAALAGKYPADKISRVKPWMISQGNCISGTLVVWGHKTPPVSLHETSFTITDPTGALNFSDNYKYTRDDQNRDTSNLLNYSNSRPGFNVKDGKDFPDFDGGVVTSGPGNVVFGGEIVHAATQWAMWRNSDGTMRPATMEEVTEFMNNSGGFYMDWLWSLGGPSFNSRVYYSNPKVTITRGSGSERSIILEITNSEPNRQFQIEISDDLITWTMASSSGFRGRNRLLFDPNKPHLFFRVTSDDD